jgi:hypothetical protein
MKTKKYIPIIAVVAVVLILGGVFAFMRMRGGAEQTPQDEVVKIPEKFNEIPVEERPYVHLAPTTESGKRVGSSLKMIVYELKKAAAKGEYELEYQSGTLLQGAFGRLNVNSLPNDKDQPIFLGSCSAGGKCSYHEEVSGGSVILRFEDTDKNKWALKNEWSYIDNSEKATTLSSRDAKFTMTGTGIARVTHAVILVPPGYPENPEQRVLSLPYAVGTLPAVTGNVEVSIRLNEDVPEATILGWDGEAWVELQTTVSDKVAAAAGPFYEAYVAVEASAMPAQAE